MSVYDIQPHQYPKFDPDAPCPIAPSKLASKPTIIRIQPAKKQANYSCSIAPWHVDDAREKSTPLIRDEHASQLNIEAYIHIYIQDTRDMWVPMHASRLDPSLCQHMVVWENHLVLESTTSTSKLSSREQPSIEHLTDCYHNTEASQIKKQVIQAR